MSIYLLKTKFQNLLRPLVRLIYLSKITPNMLTVFTCLLSVVVAVMVYLLGGKFYIMIPVFMFIRMALNAMDGMLAKEYNMITPLGAILNEMTDVISDGVLYLSFMFFSNINPTILVIVVLVALLTEYAGLCALCVGSKRRFDGPMGKSDRAFAFGLLGLLIFLGNTAYLNHILLLILGLSLITVLVRLKRALNR
ncbi:MAG: hypothetical protein A2381_05395 [Bdellovibrionales bacterium RIFOXYB1_FULL_37_110]|nr:MAG: hypothetical protein A2417_16875 [Bdellovibrionales bacterium RIFOXYC1_FULL_37_79]OFZ58181.1 MAG: hypothetical protein A2381_05395 [Bdellovibrionales bacterium RIFOXYB1_FULL_37_110]OFZ61870.1 MAG: hypothetical protein A2577_18980 [Bdellovibrionales bacterium RIFOXYD1_FULL_36_51]